MQSKDINKEMIQRIQEKNQIIRQERRKEYLEQNQLIKEIVINLDRIIAQYLGYPTPNYWKGYTDLYQSPLQFQKEIYYPTLLQSWIPSQEFNPTSLVFIETSLEKTSSVWNGLVIVYNHLTLEPFSQSQSKSKTQEKTYLISPMKIYQIKGIGILEKSTKTSLNVCLTHINQIVQNQTNILQLKVKTDATMTILIGNLQNGTIKKGLGYSSPIRFNQCLNHPLSLSQLMKSFQIQVQFIQTLFLEKSLGPYYDINSRDQFNMNLIKIENENQIQFIQAPLLGNRDRRTNENKEFFSDHFDTIQEILTWSLTRNLPKFYSHVDQLRFRESSESIPHLADLDVRVYFGIQFPLALIRPQDLLRMDLFVIG